MHSMRKLLLAFFATMLVVSGCGPETVTVGGKDPEKSYGKIVSLSPSMTEIVAQVTNVSRVVGRTAACNYPSQVAKIPAVATVKPDYEKLAILKPELIVFDGDLYSAQDVEKLKAIGADVFVCNANTVDDFIKDLYRLGSKLGSETNVSTYADRVYSARAEALAVSLPKQVKAAVIMPGQNSEHWIAGTGSFQADCVRAAAGTPVGPDGTKFVQMKAEDLVAQNPDVIFVSGNAATIMSDPRLKTVEAVKTKKVFSINSDILLRRGFRVEKLITGLNQIISAKAEGK